MNGYSGTFNGYKRTWGYNNRLQPCRIHVTTGSVPADPCNESPPTVGNILDLAYDFTLGGANNGNVISISNNLASAPSQSFSYDQLNRIQSFNYGDCANRYEVDIWANLNKMLELPGSGKPPCDYLDQLANQKNQFTGFTHDAAGNLTNAPMMGSYTYDAENRMTSTAGVTYTYDGDGRRVKKSNGTLY